MKFETGTTLVRESIAVIYKVYPSTEPSIVPDITGAEIDELEPTFTC